MNIPVPNGRSSTEVVCSSENKVCRLKSISSRNTDREPNHVHQPIKDNDTRGNPEDIFVETRREPVHQDSNCQENLCHNPLNSTEIDIVDVGGEIKIERIDFGEDIVCCSLRIGSTECRPSGRRPPGDDESEQSSVFSSSRFRRPTAC